MARPPITRARPYTPKTGKLAGITFTSERQYRNALAREKGFASWGEQQKQARKVRSGADASRLRPDEQQARRRALDAVSLMRKDGLSLGQAARAAGTTVNAVKRHAGPVLKRDDWGRYTAKASDRLVRPMLVPTLDGLMTLDVRDSRTASKIAAYHNAVKRYLDTGDDRALRRFAGRRGGVTVAKRFYPFITDTAILDRLADAGELAFDDLYDATRSAA